MNEQFYDFLLVLFSSSQPALYLKTGDIEFSFILIPDWKSFWKLVWICSIGCSTLIVITLERFMPIERSLVCFTWRFWHTVSWKLFDNRPRDFTEFISLQVKLISTNKPLTGCIKSPDWLKNKRLIYNANNPSIILCGHSSKLRMRKRSVVIKHCL